MDKRHPHPDVTKRGLVVIALPCGDQITARNPPMNNRTRYMCTAGKGHSYNQMWARHKAHGSETWNDNPLVEADQQTG